MDTESGNNDSGISSSISDEPCNSSKPMLPKHGDITQSKSHGKQAGCVRKMSIMFEEDDDVSDDADSDVMSIHHQHQKRSEMEAEWSSEEEKGRLLNAAREILVVPPDNGNNDRRVISREDTPESVRRDKGHRWRPQPRLMVDQTESASSSDRDNGLHSPGRSSTRSIDPRHCYHHHHHHHCPNVRSLKAFNMDENQQHCSCCHQLSPTWSSALYNGSQARSFPDTVSIRSLTSIGLGSSDGRKLTIRRVPTSPSELLNVVHPPP